LHCFFAMCIWFCSLHAAVSEEAIALRRRPARRHLVPTVRTQTPNPKHGLVSAAQRRERPCMYVDRQPVVSSLVWCIRPQQSCASGKKITSHPANDAEGCKKRPRVAPGCPHPIKSHNPNQKTTGGRTQGLLRGK
jgi:hypothetical protein